MRVETIGDCTLYLGDCLDVLPTLGQVDAVVTDPPYGDNLYSTDVAVASDNYRFLLDLAPCTIMFGYPERLIALCVKMGIVPSQWMTWYPLNKPNNTSKKFPLVQVQESIALFGKWNEQASIRRERTENGKRIYQMVLKRDPRQNGNDPNFTKAHDVFQDSAPGTMFNYRLRQHPNEKPVSLMEKLVLLSSREGDTVLDPFMGSGTTGVACVKTGRRFIGVEIDPTYFDIACKRIEAATLQLRLPLEEP